MSKKQKNGANFFSSKCPSREILSHVTSPWGSLILILLLEKKHRYGELKNKIEGISEKMLAQNLRILVQDGFILRTDYKEIPPKVDYTLTPIGKELAQNLELLTASIAKYFPEVMNFREKKAKKKMNENLSS